MNRTSAGAGCRHAADLPLVQSQRPASERRERTHPWLGVAALAVVVIVWSASNVVAKTVSSTGIVVSFYRLWFALPAVWIPVLLSTNWRTRLDRDWLSASLVGGTLFALHQFLFFTSLKLTSVANVTVIGALQPILVLLVADRLFEERAHAGAWLWSGVAFAGTAAVVFGSSHGLGWSWKGDVLATLNLFAFTAYFLASKHIRQRLATWDYVAGLTSTAAVWMSVLAWVTDQSLRSPRGTDWLALLWIAWFPGTVGHALSNWAHQHVSAFAMSVMFSAVPALASVAAFVWLGEPLTWYHALGGTLVFLAISAVVRKQLPQPYARRLP
mgnify:FL=1